MTHSYIDDVDDIVRQLPRIVRGQIVAPALDQHDLAPELRLQRLERAHVRGDVLPDGRVGAAARFDRQDALGGERAVLDQELLVLAREDVVGDCGWKVRDRVRAMPCTAWTDEMGAAPRLYSWRRR